MNVDLLQTAKDLIKKGVELGDMELVKMGNDLLSQVQTSPSPPITQNPAESVESPLQTSPQDVILPEETAKPSRGQYDFSFQISGNQKKGREAREDGSTLTRSEPIDLKRVHSLNMFSDDRKTDVNPGEKKLYVQPPMDRRKKPNLIRVKCDGGCEKMYSVNPIHCQREDGAARYTCDGCIKRRGKPKRL